MATILRKTEGPACSLVVLLVILCLSGGSQTLMAQSQTWNKTTCQYGLTGELFNRGIKWEDQTSTLKSTNIMLEFKARNLANRFNLRLFGGLELAKMNGLLFENLPITLEYQGGNITGIIVGVRADTKLFTVSNFNIGVLAEFASYFGFKKSFEMTGFPVTAEAKAEPDWAQASGGLMVSYEALAGSQPFLELAVSHLWGSFKMTEQIEDLVGAQTVDLKSAGLLSITLGWNFFLVDKITITPRISLYPASKFAMGGGLSICYGF
ncbi:MAG: hypothetical protein PHQ25_03485 [Acidobacteriota bacterium]|nr:hypothetical protein [Acidobacteriota bacterium]